MIAGSRLPAIDENKPDHPSKMRTDLITPTTRLQRATKKIQEQWLATREDWDDAVSQRFQERYLEPIVPQLQLALSGIHELMKVLDDATAATRDDDRQ